MQKIAIIFIQVILFTAFFTGFNTNSRAKATTIFTEDTLANLSSSSAKEHFIIQNISTKGNKRTKEAIILRELNLSIGDTLAIKNLNQILKKNRNQVYNTRLFNDVNIQINEIGGQLIDLIVAVEERWYIIPAPIFELTDDFNVWWKTYNYDLKRTEYGLLFTDENFRGRKEKLRLHIRSGYTQKIELSYNLPFIDKAYTTGITPFVSFIRNNQVAYHTINNQRFDFKSDDIHNTPYILQRFRTGLGMSRRADIISSHDFNLSYYHNKIDATLANASASKGFMFFNNHDLKQQYFYLHYIYTYDNRDIRAYPLNGNYLRFQLSKAGLGIFDDLNMLWVRANYTQYFKVSNKMYGLTNVRGFMSFPGNQPYFNQTGMQGGRNYVRGYELYIIDGQYFGLARSAMKYELINTKFKNPILKADQFKTLPIAAYAKTYAETGYVVDNYYAETNTLANTLLYGMGVGLDVIFAYDSVLSLEYSRNHLNEWGFYMGFGVNYDF